MKFPLVFLGVGMSTSYFCVFDSSERLDYQQLHSICIVYYRILSPRRSHVYLKLATDKGVPIHTPSLPRYSFFWPSMMNCTLSTVGKEAAV